LLLAKAESRSSHLSFLFDLETLAKVMGTGDDALLGKDEEIRIFAFPPDNEKERIILFKGYYLSIYNRQTEHYEKHIMNYPDTTIYERYRVPIGYTVSVRRATIVFQD